MQGHSIAIHSEGTSQTPKDRIDARSWHRRYNELKPVTRLPPELLTLIFQLTQDENEYAALRWIPGATHVYSYWRRIALDSPSLWTKIPFHRPHWATEMMVRSRTAPLIVSATFRSFEIPGINAVSFTKSGAVLKAAITQAFRIRELSLVQNYLPDEKFLALIELLDSPAPILESCNILFFPFPSASEATTLPNGMFKDSPRLKHLALANCSPNWGSLANCWANLKSLSIATNSMRDDSHPTPAYEFFSALSHMNCLETLVLLLGITFADGSGVPPSLMADFPLLKSLKFTSSVRNCLYFMDHVAYPNTAYVDVTTYHAVRDLADSNTAATDLQILHKRLYQALNNGIKSLRLAGERVSIWTFPSNDVVWDARPQLILSVSGMLHMGLAPVLLAPLHLHHLESFSIHVSRLQSADWLNLFGDLTELQTIEVGFDYMEFMYAFASDVPPSDSSNHSTQSTSNIAHPSPKFMALRNLTMIEWYFDAELADFPGQPTCYEQLQKCLKTRKSIGIGLKSLVLDDCRHVNRENIEVLEEFVEEIDWSGQSNYTDAGGGDSDSNNCFDDCY